jgi:hypothetical protein
MESGEGGKNHEYVFQNFITNYLKVVYYRFNLVYEIRLLLLIKIALKQILKKYQDLFIK